MSTPDFICSRLDQMIDFQHPLAVLSKGLLWAGIEAVYFRFGPEADTPE